MSQPMPSPAPGPVPRAIGTILPSSNRVVERVTRVLLEDRPGIDACFTRVPYAGHPPDGYDMAAFLGATQMLAQARPDVIVWNATRGALIGFEPDRRLSAAIQAETGIACTTTALATLAHLRARNLRRIGLLAQGDARDGERLKETFGREGILVAAGHNLGIRDNFAAASVPSEDIRAHAARLARAASLDAILIWSTNLPGYMLARTMDQDTPPILDSATLGVAGALGYLAG